MLTDDEKRKLIAFSQTIEEDLTKEIKQCFSFRPCLPGFGEIVEDDYIKFDLEITFSLSHLYRVMKENSGANMSQQCALIFTSEISISLFYKILEILSLQNNVINSKSSDSIINFASNYKECEIMCGPEDIILFKQHKDYVDKSLKELVGPDEPYPCGKIGNIIFHLNPIQLPSDKSIYLLVNPLIDYGININRETITSYDIKEDDIEVKFNPVDVLYKVAANIDNFKVFNINENS